MVNIGETFKTGNAVVATLPVGTVLQVVGQGQLQVGTAPLGTNEDYEETEPFNPEPGDEIYIPSKDRYGLVMRAGMTVADFVKEDEILYVDKDEAVVRSVKVSDCEAVV